MNYAKIEFLSISGVIFSPASGGFAPRPYRGSVPGPDLPLLFKLHDIWLVDSQEIIKIVATRCQILRLKCTKFDFSRWGSLQRCPRPPSWIYAAYF